MSLSSSTRGVFPRLPIEGNMRIFAVHGSLIPLLPALPEMRHRVSSAAIFASPFHFHGGVQAPDSD